TLKLQLMLWEQGVLVRKRTDNVEAYDCYLRGLASFFRFTKEAHIQAQQMLEQAIKLDPQYGEAYASLGGMYQMAGSFQWSPDPHRDLEQALALVQQALALDDSLPSAHNILSNVYLLKLYRFGDLKRHFLCFVRNLRRAEPRNGNRCF
ncbi:MAG TPA: hypothetical protein VKK81_10710, partial [Candidatus Binatia bacterium]|nr:hypothetical protein [Candidatus Binatia bacterium]